jgi:hypothetical protein
MSTQMAGRIRIVLMIAFVPLKINKFHQRAHPATKLLWLKLIRPQPFNKEEKDDNVAA